MYGLHRLINCPTRVTCNTSTLTNNTFQSSVTDASISDHSMIYCTTKVPKSKAQTTKGINFLVTVIITQLIFINRP